MNKKIIYSLFAAVFIFISSSSFAQSATMTLQLMPVSSLNLADIIIDNNLIGARDYFTLIISPTGLNVYLKGEIDWRKDFNSSFGQVYRFTTKAFTSRTISSSQLGSTGIEIADDYKNDNKLSELRELGKATGILRYNFQLYSATTNSLLSQVSEELILANPTNTMTIILPVSESVQPLGSITASWQGVPGAGKYLIRLSQRTSPTQSLEEALKSGTPLINDYIVNSNITSIDLRSILEREWLPGQELVLEISAQLDGLAEQRKISAPPISFKIARLGESDSDGKSALIALLNQLQNDKATQLIALLNNVSMNDVKFYNDQGNEISFPQFQAVVNSILSSIVKITLTNQ